MSLRTGVDLIEIERIRSAMDRHGNRFLQRVFTSAEIELCAGRVESFAARYAAKEAVADWMLLRRWRKRSIAWMLSESRIFVSMIFPN